MQNSTVLCRALFSCLFVILSSSAFGEDNSSFKIGDFIPEYFTDTRLSVSTSLNFYGNEANRSRFLEPQSPLTLDKYEYNSSSKNFNLSSGFRYRYETIPKFFDAALSISGYYRKYDYDNVQNSADTSRSDGFSVGESEEKSYEIRIFPHIEGGLYFHEDFFVSAVADAEVWYYDYPTDFSESRYNYRYFDPITGYFFDYTDHNNRTESRETKDYDFSIQLMPGWGRIYEGVFASTAMYMIDEFRKNNLIVNEPTAEQMKKLSDIIYQDLMLPSIRYQDYRIYRTEALQAITDYLISENIISDGGVYQHLLIQDVWTYFPKNSRQFGYRIKAGFGIDYLHWSNPVTAEGEYNDYALYYNPDVPGVIDTLSWDSSQYFHYYYEKSTSTFPFFGCELAYFKPFNHKWQLNLSGLARFYLNANAKTVDFSVFYATADPLAPDTVIKGEREVSLSNFYSLEYSASAVYLPTSRTRLSMGAAMGLVDFSQEVTDYIIEDSDTTKYEYDGPDLDNNFWSSFWMSATYRISIPTTLTISVEYSSGVRPANYFKRIYFDYWRQDFLVNDYESYDRSNYSFRIGITHYLL